MGIYDRDYMRERARERVIDTGSGVTSFANQVYSWMGIGLALTGLVAYALFRTGLFMSLLPFWWVFGFGTLGIAFAIQGLLERASFGTIAGLFLAYAGVEGLFFGVTLPLYAAAYGGQLIWMAFSTAAVVSGAAVCYGMFTKSDLTNVGRLFSFGVMCLLAMTVLYFLLSFFMTLTWLHLLICYVGLVLFIGLTAYDAQQIRTMSYQADVNSTASYKLSLVMALKMYINVIMIFWYLLQIFARRND